MLVRSRAMKLLRSNPERAVSPKRAKSKIKELLARLSRPRATAEILASHAHAPLREIST